MQQNLYSEAFHKHVFDTVVQHIKYYTTRKNITITPDSQLDGDLDMSIFGVSFLLDDLEKITLLNLDTTFDRISTAGDICKLIEERLHANTQTIAYKINALPLKVNALEILKIKNQKILQHIKKQELLDRMGQSFYQQSWFQSMLLNNSRDQNQQ